MYVNLNFLKSVARDNTSFMLKIIDQIIDSSPQAIEKMKNACNKYEWKEVRAAAHSLGSTVEIMGCNELKMLVDEIEDYSEEKTNLGSIPELIQRVKNIIDVAIKELQEEKTKIINSPLKT